MARSRAAAIAPFASLLIVLLAGCSGGGDGAGSDGDGTVTPPASQKDTNGWLYGVVSGTDGPLAGATVTVTGQPAVTAGADGTYLVPNLAPGPYEVLFSAQYYEPLTSEADIAEGEGTLRNIGLAEAFFAPGVPARYGLLVPYVDQDDHLIASAGAAGGMTVATEKTDDRSYYGYWKINADEGYYAVHWFVNVSWTPSETVNELGLRYFRGESLQENEITEGTASGYYLAESTGSGTNWKTFELANEDVAAFGKRTWQIGVYPASGGNEQPYGANTDYHIVITAALLSDAGFAALNPA